MRKIMIIILVLIIVLSVIYFIVKYKKTKNEEIIEYSPEQEISEMQLAQTMVTLYYKNKTNDMLVPEPRLIDSKLLIISPYEELIKLLIQGPKSEELMGCIPEGTKINNIKIVGNIVIIDFSQEFIENHEGGVEGETKTVYSIVNTLTELKEVNGVKIIINGEENREFNDGLVNFKTVFERI